ncbi:hypothetical protein BJY04DRAFT_217901 [Aspergillus karnatakaensis]|uniref:uncharacterized protein n=1 Tax=Aspergillus karnatakaensis TaxID=1810916 RepID=UPI003CCD011C
MEPRRVQFITIPLRALSSLPVSVSTPREEIGSSKLLDEDGSLPWIAHHAVRIEKSPGAGTNINKITWDYFGLTNEAGVVLDETPFIPDTIMDAGSTKWETKAIRRAANVMINSWGEYDLRNNNCQHFALKLAFDICRWCQVNQVLVDAQIQAGIYGVGNPVPVPRRATSTLEEIPLEDRDCLPEG